MLQIASLVVISAFCAVVMNCTIHIFKVVQDILKHRCFN